MLVNEIDGPLSFGAVEQIEHALLQAEADTGTVIARLGRVPFAAITRLQALDRVITKLQARGMRVLCERTPRMISKLRNAAVTCRRNVPP